MLRLIFLLTASIMFVSILSASTAGAEGYIEGGEKNFTFTYSEMTPTTVKQECQNRDAHSTEGGTVWWPARIRNPEPLTDATV